MLGKWSSLTGAAGLWPTSLRNLSELASGEGFHDYFRDSFDGNEATYLRWKEVFDLLGIEGGGGEESIETQVFRVTNSEDLVKLRALAEQCSKEFFGDASLLVVAWRRIMEVLETRKKVGEVKSVNEKGGAMELEILDACKALGLVCNNVRDYDEAVIYLKRAKEGYEEQLRRDSEKVLGTSGSSIMSTAVFYTDEEFIEEIRDVVKRCERALGEENIIALRTLDDLGAELYQNEEYKEARELYEMCLARRMKVLGEEHKDTLMAVMNIAIVYKNGLKDYGRAGEMYQNALD
ncbi:hypothetical protein TL16_g11946 [Triparma laevis f. inornata]|uniref:Kinesin light chain n=1 Tax=Triparma laevis f. inornata TaxID=1714386 RepID=A0A9W7BIH5_9STRA|nr:hypothetical protein TL16_g11946 [Triparma laevis f. inornata]